MKQFLKLVLASMVGTSLTLFLSLFFLMVMIISVATFSEDGLKKSLLAVKENSVLRIDIEGVIADHVERKEPLESLFSDAPPQVGLYEISQTLDAASKDEKIKGLLLNIKYIGGGLANLEGLRREILNFKSTGKFVIAYGEVITEAGYIVASAADEVILYPRGFFEWNGLFAKLGFFKNTMAKIDVIPQIFRVGKYKSAIEPFINDKMSPESREQIQSIILGAWGQVVSYAAEKSQKERLVLENQANALDILYASTAFKNDFVDYLSSFEDVERKLLELSGAKEEPNYVGWKNYYRLYVKDQNEKSKNKIALVFAEGDIVSGKGERNQIGSDTYSEIMREIGKEEDVKAVVMRVNSPGGSALAADVIWMSTQYVKDKKPVVTSFGNVAASGGYYMSAGSNYIYAEPTTITGSIGVFGLKFATKKMFNEHLGVTFDTEKSHKFADMESVMRLLNPEEVGKMQEVVDTIYQDFLNVVTQGRESFKTSDATHEVAQGRVWLGKEAKDIGLIDDFGGMNEALKKAAELANLKDYEVEVYPREKNPFEEILVKFGDMSVGWIRSILPEKFIGILFRQRESMGDNIYTRLPVDIHFQ